VEESSGVKDAWLRFCDRLNAKDVGSFDEVVASDAKLVIGTAPGEWVDQREGMRFGFEAEGVRLEPDDPQAYEEGSMGWLVDQPTFAFPDGSSFKVRLTTVMRQEDGRWKIVHGHFSVGVPDEEVVELQRRWSS
jgi:ketosteroid isomerase-like protein